MIDKEVYGEIHPKVATRFNNLGATWSALGDAKKAKGYFEKAYEIFLEVCGEDHPSTKGVKE